ncbi:hypothetical protein BRC86_10050 [Halobacteriales archaeon QS_3_64_16]|nr:MAG: hypothetical protein BRC86_10050 [Halobacteriales archaeon QS_3_64_16]
MRTSAALAVALLVVLAGCSAPLGSSGGGGNGSTTGAPGDAETTATSETGTGTSEGQGASTATTSTGTESGTAGTGTATGDLADPSSDRLGWENGLWYNESLSVDDSDGLNASERGAVVNRTMARIEVVRQLEYEKPISVDVITRSEFQNGSGSGGQPAAFRTFDNAKFEAMFLVGEDRNSLAVQDQNRGSSVQGYYAPGNDSIVVVSQASNPRLSASTLAHELTHALQDQQFDLTDDRAPTREAYNARNGLIEGSANFVQRRYEGRFDDSWQSPPQNESGGSGSNGSTSQLHYGIYSLEFFPYSDGPGFVASLYEQGGWEAVNAAHRNLPASTEQVIYPQLYEQDAPTNVTVQDSSSRAWERVRPGSARQGQARPDYAVLGQSALSSMFAYTLFDVRSGTSYNQSAVVRPGQVVNRGEGGQGTNSSDPLNYDLPATQGWDGDKMYVYQNDQGETGYVWGLAWDSPADAQEFATRYEDLLSHWGGNEVSENGSTSTWEIEGASRFTDAIRVQVNGDRVTITNAPTVEDLDSVHSS